MILPAKKVLTGLLTRADIASDTAFKWFAANMKLGAADAAAIAAFQRMPPNSRSLFLPAPGVKI